MHPRQIRNFEPMKVVARGEGYSYKSQGRIQGIDGSTFVCTLWGEPKERASESARKNTNECQKGTEEERLRRLGRMRHSSWASGMCWHENLRERRGPNATTVCVIVDMVPMLRVRPVFAKSEFFILTKSDFYSYQLYKNW